MIAIDTSAIIAVLNGEPEAAEILAQIEAEPDIALSAASYVETSMVAYGLRRTELSYEQLDAFLAEAKIEIVPVTFEQAQLARSAFQAFGKGSGHAARLNFGDCFAYALAKSLRVPLLYKGNDFSQTDIVSAL